MCHCGVHSNFCIVFFIVSDMQIDLQHSISLKTLFYRVVGRFVLHRAVSFRDKSHVTLLMKRSQDNTAQCEGFQLLQNYPNAPLSGFVPPPPLLVTTFYELSVAFKNSDGLETIVWICLHSIIYVHSTHFDALSYFILEGVCICLLPSL